MHIKAEKSAYHIFALYYEYDQKKVDFCRALKDTYGWQKFYFNSEQNIKRWVFSDPVIVKEIAAAFPDTIVDPEVARHVASEFKLYAAMEQQKTEVEIVQQKTDTDIVIKGIKGELYPYQRVGVEFLIASGGRAIVSDPPGLGKSLQALAYIAHQNFTRSLIVSPASVKSSWVKEIKKWTKMSYVEIDSKTDLSKIPADVQLWIINYDILKKHLDTLLKTRFDVVVSDECHMVKSRTAMRTKALIGITKHVPHVVLLSGTPLLSRPVEMFTLLNMIDPRTWNNWYEFTRKYCTPLESPVWMGDYTYKPIGKIKKGDVVIGWNEADQFKSNSKHNHPKLLRSIVEEIYEKKDMVYEYTMENGEIIRCTEDHWWRSGHTTNMKNKKFHQSKKSSTWKKYLGKSIWVKAKIGAVLTKIVDVPPPLIGLTKQKAASYLAGLYDGEGTGKRISQSRRANPIVHQKIIDCLTLLDIPFSVHEDRVDITGGRSGIAKFLHYVKPFKVLYKHIDRYTLGALGDRINGGCLNRIVSVKPVGLKTVRGMKTSTGNYIVWGHASKNCGGHQGRFGYEAKGATNTEELHTRIKRHFIRRQKKDVLTQLPPKVRIEVPVELDPSMRKQYDAAEKDLVKYLQQYEGKQPAEIAKTIAAEQLAQLNILRQITAIGKIPTAMDIIDSVLESGEKILVFSSFMEPIKQLREKYANQSVTITGETSVQDRGAIVSKFQEDANTKIFFGGIRSAGVGITLTAASNVLFLDYSWNPADMQQAEDRIHRPGQEAASVNIYQLHAEGTIDEKLLKLLKHKQVVFDKVIEGVSVLKEDEAATKQAFKDVVSDVIKRSKKEDVKDTSVVSVEEFNKLFA